jgi:branched-chain amino acid aminotransferase
MPPFHGSSNPDLEVAMSVNVVQELMGLARKARVFASMPWVEGLTPECLGREGRFEIARTGEQFERRHGIFHLSECGLSPLDHGGLYGDACFEGILVINGQVFLYREHLERWWQSAKKMSIAMPYSMEELGWWILRTIQEVGFSTQEKGYLRPVLTRGFGNLGINPAKCLAPTIYCIVSTIQLYPPEAYDRGIELSVARNTRRAGKDIVDPNIKSNNYLNNIFGLLETREKKTLETMMMTSDGFVAEATADNIFLIRKEEGWQGDPTKVHLFTPVPEYCLVGITRNLILDEARKLGYTIHEVKNLIPLDFVGPGKECFLTGTGCGLMPIVGVEGNLVGDGHPGEATRLLLQKIRNDMADPAYGISITANREQFQRYMNVR